MYIFPNVIKNSVKNALTLCVSSLIPSLFPFLTCSRILCEVVLRLAKNNTGKKSQILGISTIGLTIHFLGIISGFPSGALLASSLYKNGKISKGEAEKIIAFSNCISPSFCIMVLGTEIIGNYFCGIILFLTVAISNIICMYLLRNKFRNKEELYYQDKAISSRSSVASIIKDSSIVMLNICAFVIFFNCLGALIINIPGKSMYLNNEIKAIISALLEISSSVPYFNNLSFGKKMLYGSMLISFGGISAIMQVISVCEAYSLSYKAFIISKILSSVISPVIIFLITAIIPINFIKSTNFLLLVALIICTFCFAFILIYIHVMIHRKIRSKKIR